MTLATGGGLPVSVVAHGLGASVPETRALAGGVPGTKLFPVARGHLDAPAVEVAGYEELAHDLRTVADEHGATQAFGISLGAHTLLRILAHDPMRFTRVVLFLPAAIDTPVRRPPALVSALLAGDREAVLAAVREELGDVSDPVTEAYARSRADRMLASPGLIPLLSALPGDRPVPDRTLLRAVDVDVLVIGQEGDDLHPAAVARELAATLPRAELVVFDAPGAAFTERRRLRDLIGAHLGGTT